MHDHYIYLLESQRFDSGVFPEIQIDMELD